MKAALECMIWTPEGVWLQTSDERGIHLSGLGRLPLTSVEHFCAEHELDLIVKGPGRKDRLESHGWKENLSATAKEELAARGY